MLSHSLDSLDPCTPVHLRGLLYKDNKDIIILFKLTECVMCTA